MLETQEKDAAWKETIGFFASLEKRNPKVSHVLSELVLRFIGGKQITPQTMSEVEPNLNVGFALLGDWLEQRGYNGFKIDLTITDQAKKAAASLKYPMPSNLDTLFITAGLQQQYFEPATKEVINFAKVIRQSIQMNFTPRQIVGGLLYGSTHPSNDTYRSNELKSVLNKATNHQTERIHPYLVKWVNNQSIKS